MTTAGSIILLCYVIGIVIAFLVFRKKEEYSTFEKAWWSVFWLPYLFWKVIDALRRGW